MASFDSFEVVELNEMLKKVSPDEVPGCPKALILKHVRDAVTDFCRRTLWFCATLDPVTVVKGITEYELDDVPDDVKAGSVIWAKLSGREIGADEYSISDDGKSLILAVEPAETVRAGLEIRVALKPVAGFQTMAKHLFEEWGDVLGRGALGTLRRIPGRRWSSPAQALYDAQAYENGVVRAKNEVTRDRKNTTLQGRPRRFAI